jgi:hypothetical protein
VARVLANMATSYVINASKLDEQAVLPSNSSGLLTAGSSSWPLDMRAAIFELGSEGPLDPRRLDVCSAVGG